MIFSIGIMDLNGKYFVQDLVVGLQAPLTFNESNLIRNIGVISESELWSYIASTIQHHSLCTIAQRTTAS